MFIEITTPTNPLRIENILHPYKHGKKPFTPELAKQILSSTNYPRSIRDMLTLIANLPTSEQAQYKNLVISTFDHREQPNDITIIGKKLAIANNYENELNKTIQLSNGIRYASAIKEIADYICADKKPDLSKYPPNINLYCTNDTVNLSDTNLSTIKNFKFKKGSKVYLSGSQNLPEDLDVSMCSEVALAATNLAPVKSLKFKEGSTVYLHGCQNLPEDLDVSMCNEVVLNYTNLAPVKSLKFKEGSKIQLANCRNLPEDLDISMCSQIHLGDIDLTQFSNLKFKKGSAVSLNDCKSFPENLDVSMCDTVELSYTDLSKIKKLKFKEGSTVYFNYCENLPENLDISMCSKVNLYSANISNVKTLTFKNKTQQNESWLKIPKNWQGKIVYTEEIPTNSTFRFQTSNTR